MKTRPTVPRKQTIDRANARAALASRYNIYGDLIRKQTSPEVQILSVKTGLNQPARAHADEDLRSSNTGKRKSGLLEGEYEESGEETLREDQHKRLRTIAPFRPMGTKVSQLIEGYEQNRQQASGPNGNPHNTSSNGFVGVDTRGSTAQFTQPLRTNNLGDHYTALRRLASPHPRAVTARPAAPRFQSMQYNYDIVQATMHKVDKPRSWMCHCCKAQGMVYNFDAHMECELVCPRKGCGHECCGYCTIESVGELCEKKPWHGHAKGYWGWMMDMGLKVDSEEEASGEDVEAKSFL